MRRNMGLVDASSCSPRLDSGSFFFFLNDTATTEIYTLSLHDALPISARKSPPGRSARRPASAHSASTSLRRSEEHTSELQSRFDLVCRLLLDKKTTTGPARLPHPPRRPRPRAAAAPRALR